jgi:putative lipoprotein
MQFKPGLFIILFTIMFSTHADDMKTVDGSVYYRERMLLPPGAEIKVNLEDVSKMDVPAEIIATTTLAADGGPPWDFTLQYDPAGIKDTHTYALRARIEADGRLIFTSTDRIPAFAGSEAQPAKILVSRVGDKRRGGDSKTVAPGANASLINTYWKPVKLNNQAVALGAGKKELNMILVSEENRVRGFSGCNQFSGHFNRDGDQLVFKPIMSTMKACMNSMEQERRFLDALEQTTRFGINGETLSLYDSENKLLLQFKAVYLH